MLKKLQDWYNAFIRAVFFNGVWEAEASREEILAGHREWMDHRSHEAREWYIRNLWNACNEYRIPMRAGRKIFDTLDKLERARKNTEEHIKNYQWGKRAVDMSVAEHNEYMRRYNRQPS